MLHLPRTTTVSVIVCLCVFCGVIHGWTADNGNGTFTNPLFYDEFSDPDMIRVGDDYYLTGTTMHSMPGLPVVSPPGLQRTGWAIQMS